MKPLIEQLSEDDEKTLVARAKTSPDGFRTLYRHYLPRVYGYVAHRVGAREDAEDLTAEVFMRALTALPDFEFRGGGSLTAWLFRIAHHAVITHYRQRGRREIVDVALDDLPEIQSRLPGPDDVLVRKEQYERLRQAINALSERRQTIISLRFYGGLRNNEIAAALDLDERTVASHLSRGLNDLRQRLVADYGPGSSDNSTQKQQEKKGGAAHDG